MLRNLCYSYAGRVGRPLLHVPLPSVVSERHREYCEDARFVLWGLGHGAHYSVWIGRLKNYGIADSRGCWCGAWEGRLAGVLRYLEMLEFVAVTGTE